MIDAIIEQYKELRFYAGFEVPSQQEISELKQWLEEMEPEQMFLYADTLARASKVLKVPFTENFSAITTVR